ncbi:MAG: hypothetical protein LAT61_06180 [Alcanivorax sp.]|nr:hypothetical protein [Alcanivorax sp.]
MLSGFLSSGLVSAQDPQQSQQNLLDNLQRESQQRQERRLDDVLLPGRDPSVQPTVPDTPDDARCFPVQRVEFVELDGEPLVRWSWLARSAESHLQQHANCLSLAGVQAMQRLLGNQLIERGFVASRILLPEQDLSEGVLHLLVVPGHLEGFSAQGLHRRQLVMAVPGKQGRPVNLRDLEQGIENLARLPGMDPRLDIAPGAEQGGTRIVADATWPRRYRASLALNEKYYGSTAHGTARAMLELGAPLTLTDRLVLSVNSDLDTAYSDKAVGGSVDYDIAVGYWLAALGFSRQEYRNDIDGIHQSFSASGTTEISRVDLGRVVYRSAATHVSLGIQGAHSDVSNLLDRATIQVSSYRLRTLGLRGEIKRLQAGMQWAVGLTTERSWADGPATRLPGGARVADPINQRWLLYLSASRPVSGGVLQGRLNGQFSNADLFASQRFSLTAHTRGYEDISVTANSAYSGGLEYSLTPRVWRGVGLRPFLALDSGIVPGASNEPGSVALSSMTAGMSAGYRRAQFTMEANRPLPDLSTERSANDYALRASLSLSY